MQRNCRIHQASIAQLVHSCVFALHQTITFLELFNVHFFARAKTSTVSIEAILAHVDGTAEHFCPAACTTTMVVNR